jgi:protein-S-isoprenylcysteine O-methyltransferase Ste14
MLNILATSTAGAAEPLIFGHGTAKTVFFAVVLAWALFESANRVRQHVRSQASSTLDPSAFVLVPCMGGAVVGAVLLGKHGGLPWPGGQLWPVVAGIALIVAGAALRAWSIVTLGRMFQYWIKIQPGHQVVTGGPYRYVRHPSYTALSLCLIGFALGCGDVWSLLVMAVLGGIALGTRIWVEERQLTAALGTEYEQFAATRKRLVPGVF